MPMISLISDLPTDVVVMVCREWLNMKDLVYLDSSICAKEHRITFIESLKTLNVVLEGTKNAFVKDGMLHWLKVRKLPIAKLCFNANLNFTISKVNGLQTSQLRELRLCNTVPKAMTVLN